MAQVHIQHLLQCLEDGPGNEDEEVTPYEREDIETQMFCRDLARHLQCPACARPFRNPVTLLCGHSFCSECALLEFSETTHLFITRWNSRRSILVPPSSRYACLFSWCDRYPCPKSSVQTDVQLANVVNSLQEICLKAAKTSSPVTESRGRSENGLLYVVPASLFALITSAPSQALSNARSLVNASDGGEIPGIDRFELLPRETWLGSLFRVASEGKMPESSFAFFYNKKPLSRESLSRNYSVDRAFRDAIVNELMCYICRSLVYRPVTTCCGHTFCWECLQRNADYQSPCPVCRRPETLRLDSEAECQKVNLALNSLITHLFPRECERRQRQLQSEFHNGQVPSEIPLFQCAIAFPSCPSYLHIFEPRYRLMMRRTYKGNKRFAMVAQAHILSSTYGENSLIGEDSNMVRKGLPVKTYMEYGTIMEIKDRGWLIDGRSYIESFGLTKIRITKTREHDGYLMATYEQVDDLPDDIEADIEKHEIQSPRGAGTNLTDPDGHGSHSLQPEVTKMFGPKYWDELTHMTTKEMAAKVLHFTRTWMTEDPFRSERPQRFVLDKMPVDNPRNFPYWVFYALQSPPDEMYMVLRSRSMRERLKLAVIKIDRINSQFRPAPSVFTLLFNRDERSFAYAGFRACFVFAVLYVLFFGNYSTV